MTELQNHKPFASFDEALAFLDEIVRSGMTDFDANVKESVSELRELARNIELADWNSDVDVDADELFGAIIEGANILRCAIDNDMKTSVELTGYVQDVSKRFSFLVDDSDQLADCWSDDHCEVSDENDVVAPSADEIGAILSTLQADTPASQPDAITSEAVSPESNEIRPENIDNIEHLDDELREAFLDDAQRCLAGIEKALLTLESNPNDRDQLKVVGRELHTIKGASATIGFGSLASQIHDIEDSLREITSSQQPVSIGKLFSFLDSIRAKVDGFRNQNTKQSPIESAPLHFDPLAQHSDENDSANTTSADFEEAVSDDESVRIKASSLNRMMDMLSELVMLRNQRDTELGSLTTIHESMIESVSRLRLVSLDSEDGRSQREHSIQADSGTQLNEITNDLLELSHDLRESYQPICDGNTAVSDFIRSFRQELVELRRTPIEGLFRRLRRAISDAARIEDKKVKLVLRGEETGIERSLQARLFEPLLHIVRNAVSHGIESAEDRQAAGKPAQGQITLQAFSGPDLLSIEIRDDGKGLDYDAIRRRGIERGLLAKNSAASRAELAQLIFHPGFSTQDVTTQVSGRGVGMDVVAATLERMRGWVEIDSAHGKGTVIRLSLPLPSMIQHAMVFRTAGQLFAIPMQAIQSAGDPDPSLQPVCVNQLLQVGDALPAKREMIVLGSQGTKTETEPRMAILVDQIIGPEEVVVRPLPRLFKQHPICAGATLSGLGEAVLLLDAKRLTEANARIPSSAVTERNEHCEAQKVLVVDDSTSARMRVIKSLGRHGLQIVQSRDGQEAWNVLQQNDISAVFSDIEMPNMTGLELLQKIKSSPQHQHMPVILISSRTEEEFTGRAKKLGAMACLPKPLNDASLDALLSQLPTHNANLQSLPGKTP